MSTTENSSSCTMVCWLLAALFGVICLLLSRGDVGMVAAVLIGVAIAVILGFAFTQLFCGAKKAIATATSGAADDATQSDVPLRNVGPSPAAALEAIDTPTEPTMGVGPSPTIVPDAVIADEEPVSETVSVTDSTPDYDGDGVKEGTDEGKRPEALSEARDGGADDLKQIKGVGPKMEQLLNSLGFYHFDQIAGWSGDEVAWVDANLKGFKGRVSRDGWVAQAQILASGGETEFSARVEDGKVY